ncbi:MAG TPA: preprotein translocase subunit SecE [Patescibacteria group bacterium]
MKRLATPFRLVVQYLKGAYQELRQVSWPSRQAVLQYSLLVIVTIVISVAVLTVFDYGLQQLANRYLLS